MRSFHFALCTIVVVFPMFAAACAGSTLPPLAVEPTKSTTQTTLTHPANTPLPTTIEPRPTCTEIGQTWTAPADGVILVCVPAGEFLMGAADDDPLAEDDEKPQHRVYLDAFWIERTEVTNANFAKCMAEGACRPQVYELSAKTYTPYAIHPDYQDFPALLYKADVAAAYCQWAGRRLPTEAEWEKAARGTDGGISKCAEEEVVRVCRKTCGLRRGPVAVPITILMVRWDFVVRPACSRRSSVVIRLLLPQ